MESSRCPHCGHAAFTLPEEKGSPRLTAITNHLIEAINEVLKSGVGHEETALVVSGMVADLEREVDRDRRRKASTLESLSVEL